MIYALLLAVAAACGLIYWFAICGLGRQLFLCKIFCQVSLSAVTTDVHGISDKDA